VDWGREAAAWRPRVRVENGRRQEQGTLGGEEAPQGPGYPQVVEAEGVARGMDLCER
jgi:hypothetical protein